MVGDYQVREKRADRAYYTREGRTIPSQHADNPYGRVWLHLGGEMCIHGSPTSARLANSELGCIGLSPIDANDVYGILSQGSKVTVRR
jgi:lipoprotein-anchoring transpeptidase ErfK/SrfK